ncbi:MAG: divergent PAP2 family protein [Gracilibacteraceae bacterium]|jgi:acid phosphatase family membrane protein YuiD|nr:divergent PAP2 family protein [Gracilibacteraceae bacterium]
MDFFNGIMANRIMWIALLAWLVAQFCKLIFHFLVERRLDFSCLKSSGGFPSSHTAIVCALAGEIGKASGWSSPIFAVAVVLAVIVMYDAANVRWAAGEQARAINHLLDMLLESNASTQWFGQEIPNEKLKEIMGHTPFEVFGGAILGMVIAAVF